MMKRCKWRSRLIAVILAIATWLLVTVPAQSTFSFDWEDNPWLQTVANRHNVPQTKQQDSGQTVFLRVEGVLETGDLAFEDGSLYDVHPFEGESGQAITIHMMSDEFDTYLILVNAEGEAIGRNDDSTSLETNSTLTILLPETGTYRIIANAFDATGQGNYQITVSIASDFEVQQLEADRLFLQGGQQYQVSQFQAALQSWQQALEIYQSIGMSETAVYALSGIGNAYFSLGQYQQASSFYHQSLEMADDLGDRQAQATALGNLGLIYEALGQYQQAIESHQQSLAVDRAINNRRGEAVSLGNLGNVYYFLGQYQRAIEFHQQSLAINRNISNRQGEAVSLGNLGLAHGALDQYQQAIDLHQQSLAINRDIGNRQGENTTLDNLGSVYYSLGQYQQALDLYQQALDIALEIGDRQGEGNLLVNLGEIHNALGQYQQALDLYQQALGIAREISDRQVEAIALNNLGSLFISTNQWAEAEIALTQSIEAYELLRTDLSDTQLISIADTQAATYAHLEKALTAQGKTAEALETTERARARAFVLQLASRLSNPEEPVAPDGSNLDGSNGVNSASIAEIQQIARNQNATLVTYSLIFDEALYIWVVQPSGEVEFRSVELGESDSLPNPIATIDGPVYRGDSDASELDTLVAETRAGIGVVANSIPSERLKDLHQILIDPIADLLPTDPNANVVFVPQGSLFLVPFAALQDTDGTYLIEKHTVLTAPSIQVLGLVSRDAPGQSSAALLQQDNALVVGNPLMPEVVVLGDEGLQPIRLAPLPGAEAEALDIGNFLNISPLIGDQATEAQIKQQLPTASLIHLATHGLLEYGDPQSSGVLDLPGALALTPGDGEDGLLTAAEILEMDLQAELAVLSACDTGRGRITGDGVVGLSRSLITAGVPSVIVSLWAVPDAPTAALMTEFYRQLQQGRSKAQALRQAMLATLNDSPEPVNWAAFTLMGAIE
ncbi:MAG: CHAT domain-containing tetratricopeptide repeat protein [Cyanobacteria bacterium J06635_15]